MKGRFFLKRDYYLKNLVVDILVDAREGVGDTKARPHLEHVSVFVDMLLEGTTSQLFPSFYSSQVSPHSLIRYTNKYPL